MRDIILTALTATARRSALMCSASARIAQTAGITMSRALGILVASRTQNILA